MSQALLITGVGMAGVFVFLILLITIMNILHFCIAADKAQPSLNKIAAAIAFIKYHK